MAPPWVRILGEREHSSNYTAHVRSLLDDYQISFYNDVKEVQKATMARPLRIEGAVVCQLLGVELAGAWTGYRNFKRYFWTIGNVAKRPWVVNEPRQRPQIYGEQAARRAVPTLMHLLRTGYTQNLKASDCPGSCADETYYTRFATIRSCPWRPEAIKTNAHSGIHPGSCR